MKHNVHGFSLKSLFPVRNSNERVVQNIKVQIFHWWCDKWCENAGRFNASSQQSPLLCKHGLHLHHDENEGIKN